MIAKGRQAFVTVKMRPFGVECVLWLTRLPPQRNRNIDVRPRAKLNDSVEVFIGDESIGLIHADDEDGDKSYIFNMSILDIDLDEVS